MEEHSSWPDEPKHSSVSQRDRTLGPWPNGAQLQELTHDRQVIEGPAGVIRGCEAFVVLTGRIPELYVGAGEGPSFAGPMKSI